MKEKNVDPEITDGWLCGEGCQEVTSPIFYLLRVLLRSCSFCFVGSAYANFEEKIIAAL